MKLEQKISRVLKKLIVLVSYINSFKICEDDCVKIILKGSEFDETNILNFILSFLTKTIILSRPAG